MAKSIRYKISIYIKNNYHCKEKAPVKYVIRDTTWYSLRNIWILKMLGYILYKRKENVVAGVERRRWWKDARLRSGQKLCIREHHNCLDYGTWECPTLMRGRRKNKWSKWKRVRISSATEEKKEMITSCFVYIAHITNLWLT